MPRGHKGERAVNTEGGYSIAYCGRKWNKATEREADKALELHGKHCKDCKKYCEDNDITPEIRDLPEITASTRGDKRNKKQLLDLKAKEAVMSTGTAIDTGIPYNF